MVKSLLQICFGFVKKPCNSNIVINKYWLNCGMACIPFKLYHHLIANEFYYCSCRFRIFKIKFLKINKDYSVNVRANNCFHFWFVFMLEIKVKKPFNKRNNIVHFTSLLIDFFSFINKFKYIYLSPDFQNSKYFDSMFDSFPHFLNEYDSCLCYHPQSGPF